MIAENLEKRVAGRLCKLKIVDSSPNLEVYT